jgi:tryptophan-rich sensory protein
MSDTYYWYQQLIKPSWAPPNWLFGPVWTALYIIIAVSFGAVVVMAWKKKIPPAVVLPFVLNLVFNFSFTYFQFGLKNNLLAAGDILAVLGTLIWALAVIRPYASWVAFANIPYLLWVCFATVLQLTVTYLNR